MNERIDPDYYARSDVGYVPAPASPMLMVSLILTSALYLSGVFIAGLITDHRDAWLLALACMGICYFTAFVQLVLPTWRLTAIGLVTTSIIVGAAAGWSLVI